MNQARLRQNGRVSLSFQPLSPLDGRYASQVQDLSLFLSEAGLNRARIQVEIEWIILLANKELFGRDRYITEEQSRRLRSAVEYFSDADCGTSVRASVFSVRIPSW